MLVKENPDRKENIYLFIVLNIKLVIELEDAMNFFMIYGTNVQERAK